MADHARDDIRGDSLESNPKYCVLPPPPRTHNFQISVFSDYGELHLKDIWGRRGAVSIYAPPPPSPTKKMMHKDEVSACVMYLRMCTLCMFVFVAIWLRFEVRSYAGPRHRNLSNCPLEPMFLGNLQACVCYLLVPITAKLVCSFIWWL